MRISRTTRNPIRNATVSLLATLGLASAAAHAAGAQTPADDTYEWSAVLMSYDGDAGTAVLQARFESYVEIPNLDEFEDGDRLTLVWTGRNWAAGVRDLARDPALTEQSLTLPVEFVSTARDDAYLNFRIQVPESARAVLESMEEGARVTGVSPRQPDSMATALISLRHYNDVS